VKASVTIDCKGAVRAAPEEVIRREKGTGLCVVMRKTSAGNRKT